ncbi:MAG: VID27 cytoplasmic protein-domain-containing protein [Podila humilis]|nr:MAG: VID27 cytoplasmic protein-domain-containing protein [Podila humilis]
MNIFKTLNGMVWGNNASQDLVAIPSGDFYVIGLNMQRTCRYIDARATIKRTSMPFQYRLCVERIYEEGEDTLEGEDDDDDEHSVLIDKAIQFKVRMVSGSTAFTWKGMSKDSQGLTFEFVCAEETTAFTANNFEITVYQCMYERQYNHSHVDAEEDAIAEFQIKSLFNTPVPKGTRRSPRSPRQEEASFVPHNIPTPSLRPPPTVYHGVIDVPADLCLWDDSTALFYDHALNVRCQLVRERRDTYWLLIMDGKSNQHLAQKLEPRMSPVFSPENLTFIWNYSDDKQNVYSWLLRFKDDNVLRRFQTSYANCMSDVLNNQPASVSANSSTSSSAIRSQRSSYGFEQSDDHDEEDDEEDEVEGDRGENSEDDGDDSDGSIISSFDQNDGTKNSELAVGYKDRSFVVRGSKVGVFGYGKSDGLKFHTTIKNLKNKAGNEIKPSQVVLHEEDTSMVMLDPRNKHQAYKMDLEYGKIVEEWNLHGTSGVCRLIGDGKYAHTTQSKTMLGLAEDAIFRIDSRLPGGMIVENEKKQYSKGNKFLCGATSSNGSLAMASSKDIMLFNKIGGIATVSIPTLGSPVIGIDVAGSGRWVLATCKEYIMLFDVLNSKNNALGFDRRFLADDKPVPIKLQLLPGHVAAMRAPVSFTPARFNTGANEEEMQIVTSTGPYVITWNFRRVKLGHREYSMREYQQKVVADNFRYGQSRSIIVTLPDDVAAVSTGKMVQVSK